MTKEDLINAARSESPRFQKWFAWVLPEEITVNKYGRIVLENDHDGAGLTEAGLEQRDDGLRIENGICINPPAWFVAKYVQKYWNGSRAGELPTAVGECVANFTLNTGEGVRFLQEALNEEGFAVAIDNQIGDHTLAAAWRAPDSKALARCLCAHAESYYYSIAHRFPPSYLVDWLRRTHDLEEAFCV